jgi:hypothetical protein
MSRDEQRSKIPRCTVLFCTVIAIAVAAYIEIRLGEKN